MRYVECISEDCYTAVGKRYEIVGESLCGKYWTIIDDDFAEENYPKANFGQDRIIEPGDSVTIEEDCYSFITKDKLYKVIQVDGDGYITIEDNYGGNVHFELHELGKIVHQESIENYDMNDIVVSPSITIDSSKEELARFMWKLETNTDTNKNAEANEEKTMNIAPSRVAPKMIGTKGTNKFTEKFGTFGKIDGVALTMTGTMAVIGLDGNYYSYENDTLVSHDDMVIDGIPGFAMPALRSTLKAGDIILDNDKGFLFVDKQKNLVSYDGTVHKIAKQSHAMFGTAMDFVSKVMDMSVMMNGQQQGLNPMMMMLMMKDEDNKGDSGMKEMMKMMMMGQMMNGGQQTDNPMANPMMMMAMMDDKDSEAMKMMFMMQFMQNQNKEAK